MNTIQRLGLESGYDLSQIQEMISDVKPAGRLLDNKKCNAPNYTNFFFWQCVPFMGEILPIGTLSVGIWGF